MTSKVVLKKPAASKALPATQENGVPPLFFAVDLAPRLAELVVDLYWFHRRFNEQASGMAMHITDRVVKDFHQIPRGVLYWHVAQAMLQRLSN